MSAGELERLREQQRAVSEVLRVVARSEGLQSVLDEIVAAATRLCAGDNGRLWLVRDGLLHVLAGSGDSVGYEHDREHPHTVDRTTMAGRAALSRRPVHVADVDADAEYTYSGPRRFRANLSIPILLEDELIGVIGIVRVEPDPFSDDEIELVRTFADQAAIAIANARLLDAVERQLEQQRAISNVLGAVARSEGLDSVFAAVVEAAARLCEAEHGQVHVADGDVFRLAGDYGSDPELVEYERSHPHVRDRTSVVGRVALSRKVEHIPDVVADPEYSYPTRETGGFRAMLGVPIFVEADLIGVINLVRNEAKPFSQEQIDLVGTFADQAAIAIANARLLDAVERQRTELARFVSPQVAELLSREDGHRLLAGHRAYVSVFFSDLRGFTAFAETAAPEDLFDVLREYHALIGELLASHHGTLEHFAGDGVMVFFNDPVPIDEHELEAIRMALTLQERFVDLATLWRKRGIELGLGIGIAAGYATLGRIGFEGRYDYGALGPVTNLASRLSTKAEAGQILISQRLLAAVEATVDAMPVGDVELKGFARPVAAYEACGLRSS